ncbi:complement C3-like [Megalops cyprinoides]|uniref:complement C3-like n=1 Tax=Megalops cyprinoides TaxID=118141 RepID=UPI00186474BD|nr:complement C3-like [Megalops cyprinoides]
MAALGFQTLCFCSLIYTFQAQFTTYERRPWLPRRHPWYRPRYDDVHRPVQLLDTSSPRFVLLAPNLIRTDSKENIFLEAYGLSEPKTVNITAHHFPIKEQQLLHETVVLDEGNNYQALKAIELPSHGLNKDEQRSQYVYLKADFGSYVAEVVVMVSFQSGYIFIQTDKPLFNPRDVVHYRAFVATPAFKAFNSSISIEIQNPDGITIHAVSKTMARDGIFADNYQLSEIANEGIWKITAKFDNRPQNKFSTDFEVRKYVLPAFNVTLTPRKSYFSVDDTQLVVDITASYLYGEPVKGTAYIVFGVEVNKEKRRFPHSMKLITDLERGTAVLTMDDIKKSFPNIKDLVGCPIYVKASVLTSTGSDLVEAERSGIKILESPYKISFSNTPLYFKPGLPFDLMVQVTHHDGSLAPNVPFQLSLHNSPVTSHPGISRLSINMPMSLEPQTITVETKESGLKPENQAKQQMTLQAYIPFNRASQNFLYVSAPDKASAGEVINLKLYFRNDIQMHKDLIKHLTYLVLNKGKIIDAQRVVRFSGQEVINVPLIVTPEMIPSFRFVVYYALPWLGRVEIVADSVRVDVEDTCVGALRVSKVGRRDVYRPGETFRIEVRGDPGAKVSLLAVDNAVFLLNSKYRLTQSKIWDVVEKGDMGCTPGGGRDRMGVFADAGLLFFSNTAGSTPGRQSLQCPRRARRRRSARLLQHRTTLESQYEDRNLRRCCQDGMREIPMDYSCVRRSHYITEGLECVQAFLLCCFQYRGEEPGSTTAPPTTTIPTTTQPPVPTRVVMLNRVFFHETASRVLTQAKSPIGMPGMVAHSPPRRRLEEVEKYEYEFEDDDDEGVIDERDVYIRSKFFETWLRKEISLPSTPEKDSKDGLAVLPVESVLPDSITEWGVLAVSSSPETGFCVAEPYNVISRKRFFVDLRLPYSVARNEQVEIKAVLHNYGDEDLKVIVILYKTEDICSVAFTEDHRQEVTLPSQSSRAIPYTIVPLKAGELEMEVKALARGYQGSDGVRKRLRVVVEGLQKTKVQSFILNPSVKGDKEGKQVVKVDGIGLESVVPNSFPETYINVRGNLLADTIDNSINGDALASLIRMPGGCVEQNLASITLPLIATHYLDKTLQWESVGVQRRVDAITYIQRGYEKQLAYRKKDNSYPPYRNEGTSTWITAYVVKVFAMAQPIISVATDHLCGPLLYLLKEKQLPSGAFREDNPVYAAAMMGGLQGTESSATLTAFVIIAMSEAKAVVNCRDPNIVPEEKLKGAAFHLRRLLPRLRRPYSVAIAAYALALVNPSDSTGRLQLERVASADRTHWSDEGNPLFTLEATGYALLALVKMGQMERAALPFQWLNERRKLGGGYGSTQPTMVVLQGLSEYLIHKPPPQDLSLRVAVSMPGRRDVTWSFEPKTAYVARSAKTTVDRKFTVVASGKGQGVLEVVTVYNQLPDVHEKGSCRNFELEVAIKETHSRKPSEDAERSYRLDINVRSLEQTEMRMVVLDITLPTGFVPDTKDLEMLTNSVDRYINNFEIVEGLSDRGSLIIHLFKVSNREKESVSFRLLQKFKVGLIQPSSVTVYEYYNPDHRCSKFYNPMADEAELKQICSKEICQCAEGNCCVSKAQDQPLDNVMREDAACQGIYHVYKVKVSKINRSQYDTFEMEILQVIKEGKDEGIRASDTRTFIAHAGCRGGLDLEESREYLIMGPPEDVWHMDSSTNRFTYTLGKKTWVERWPTAVECGSVTGLKQRCTQLQEFASDILERGCIF